MKRYIITGASSGIGYECAKRLIQNGDSVILASRKRPELSYNDGSVHIETDFSSPGSGSKLVQTIKSRELFPVDGIVHCAGVAPLLDIQNNDINTVRNAYEINVLSFVDMLIALSEFGRGGYKKNASIVAISSVVSMRGSNRQSLYAGTKAALEDAVLYFSKELYSQNVRVNAIVSGAVKTEMLNKLIQESPGLEERMKKYYPLGVIQTAEIFDTIDFLLSEKSIAVNGLLLPFDSGYLL